MIFKKPYAFFIKYFRLINFILTSLFLLFALNLWKLHVAITKLSSGSTSNYSTLNTFVGFKVYLLIFVIAICLIAMIVLLKRKDKPYKDYLYGLLYDGILLVYIMSISSMFLSIDTTIIEVSTMKVYRDISLLVIFPLFYFVISYFLVVIGFSIKKFNFSKDLLELKQDEKDNEEVEIVFDKNTYKYKRKIRKTLRELKYYILENKLILYVILGILILSGLISLFSINLFASDKVKLKEKFSMSGYTVSVNKLYETEYSLNNRIVKSDSKFIIADVNIINNRDANSFDFKKIRLLYGKDYVYPNDYFNKYFYDIGKPYSNTVLKTGENYNYIFIFKVPKQYKSKKYTLKFYDGIVYGEDDVNAKYLTLKTKVKNLDSKNTEENSSLNQIITLNKKSYGKSSISLNSYQIKNNFIVDNNGIKKVIKSKEADEIVLELGYDLTLDSDYNISKYFTNYDEFISNFISLEYIYNGREKEIYNLSYIKDDIDNKTYLSIPYQVNNAEKIKIKINLRDKTLIYNLK